jgi:small subunit ribosomal protein S7
MVKKDKILKNLFYAKFLGVLMKKGKKTSAKKILDNVLVKVSRKTGLSVNLILYKVFFKLNTFVEIRRIRFRRSSHIVPFSIPFSRRIFLVLKWIFLSIKFDKRKIGSVNKLSVEIFKILKNLPSSQSLKLKALNNSQAFANKANIHFRW